MPYKYGFLDYLELLENCRNSEDELFYLNTKTELYDFRKKKKGVWKCGFVKFKFPNINEAIKSQKDRRNK